MPPPDHPTPDRLDAFAVGRVTDAELTAIAAHLSECADCCARLDHRGAADPVVARLRTAAREEAENEPTRVTAVRAIREVMSAARETRSGESDPTPDWARRGAVESAEPLVQPVRVGPYEIGEQVGRGGMGVVYAAWHAGLSRKAAVKLVPAGQLADETDRLRLRLEAELAARVRHPNVVQVYDVGEYDGCPYLAMEWAGGGNLSEALGDAPWPADAAARFVRTVAGAVQAAHDQGVVHRDLKPANILLDGEPGTDPAGRTPKVSDFGLARPLAGPGASRSAVLAGTPEYMAPEQVAGGRAVGPAADVYALGGLLFRLLTGRVPFPAGSPMEVLAAVTLREPPRPRRLNRAVPPDLEAVCLKCLEKPPDRRYESARALADDLGRFLDRKPVAARRVGRAVRLGRWARRHPGTAALLGSLAAALVVGFGLVTWKWREADGQRRVADDRRGDAEANARAADANRREARRNLYAANVRLAKHAIDSTQLAHAAELLDEAAAGEPGDDDLRGFEWYYLHRLARPAARVVTRYPAPVSEAAFSKDGRLAAVWCRDHVLRVTDVAAGREVFAFPIPQGTGVLEVSPDGGRVAAAVGAGVQLWDTRTWAATRLDVGHAVSQNLAFSPDGRRLAVPGSAGGVQVWDVEAGVRATTFRPDGVLTLGLAYSPDGRRLAVAGGDNLVRVCSADDGRVLVRSAPLPWGGGKVLLAYRPDGREIAVNAEPSAVRLLDAETGAVRRVLPLASHGGPNALAYSPGGRVLTAAGLNSTVRVWEVATGQEVLALRGVHTRAVFGVTVTADGRMLTASHDHTLVEWDPAASAESFVLGQVGRAVSAVAWSPDGGRVAAASVGGYVRVWAADGGPEPITISAHSIHTRHLAFSPDGRRLVTAGFDRDARIWDAATGQVVHNLEGHTQSLTAVAFSPDGRWVATAAEDGTARTWDAATGRPVRVLPAGGPLVTCVAFAPDGRSLAAGNEDGMVRVWDVGTDGPARVLAAGCGPVFAIAYRPTGDQLAVAGLDGAEVWDVAGGRRAVVLRGHAARVQSVAYSPDGRRIATAGFDDTLRFWDATGGRELLTLGGVRTTSLAYSSPDGRRVATGGEGVRVWEAFPLPPELLRRRRLTQ